MKSILWRKLNLLKNSKARLISYIISPIIILLILHYRKINNELFSFSYLLITSCFLSFVIFSVEDLAFSEVILACPKSLKKLWLSYFIINLGFTILLPYFIINLYSIILKKEYLIIFLKQGILAGLLSSSLQLLGTVHFSDYSRFKQLIASISIIVYLGYSVFIMIYNKIFFVDIKYYNYVVGVIIFSLLNYLLAFIIFGKGNIEKLLINTKPLLNTVKDNSNIIVG